MVEYTPKPRKKGRRWIIVLVAILIALIAASLLVIRQLRRDGFDLSEINPFPFGGGTGQQEPPDGGIITPPVVEPPDGFDGVSRARLRRLTDFPVSGYRADGSPLEMLSQAGIALFNETRGNAPNSELETIQQPLVRYVRQPDGNILETTVGMGLEQTKVSNTLIPNSAEAFIDSSRNNIIYRYYNDRLARIETFLAQLAPKQFPVLCSQAITQATSVAEVPDIDLGNFLSSIIVQETPDEPSTSELILAWQGLLGLDVTGELDGASFLVLQENCQEREVDYQNIQNAPQTIDNGIFLEEDLAFVDIHPTSGELISIQSNDNQADGFIIDFDRPNFHRDVLESVFNEWIPDWINDDLIILNTTTSEQVDGFTFALNPKTSKFEKILGPLQALTSLADPSGRYILFSQSDNFGRPAIAIYDREIGRTYRASRQALPEKCVWAHNTKNPTVFCAIPKNIAEHKLVPDDWYKDLESFNDNISLMELIPSEEILKTTFLFDLQSTQPMKMDATSLWVDPDNNFVFFINKITGELWSLEVDGLYTIEEDIEIIEDDDDLDTTEEGGAA